MSMPLDFILDRRTLGITGVKQCKLGFLTCTVSHT